ncbi:LLM class flavin-dependent oxidoreductase [Actinocrispum sp. NPDC049592]|uniref:LLM class flavin-dependent oxidoreductase n=1 Tax=Actinocrispum sp. NPDC049592 TaxID=3154835 RepID=UPI0034412902
MRFHWSIPGSNVRDPLRGSHDRDHVNPVEDIDGQLELCKLADEGGIDSLLLPTGYQRADPIAMATYFGGATRRVKYMVAIRPGTISPTLLVTQVNTVAAVTGGRITINVVAGHNSTEMRFYGDFLSHDERFQRSDEFWSICHALWRAEGPVDFHGSLLQVEGARVNTPFLGENGRTRPELYFGGSSDLASDMAIKHGDCLLRLGDTPDRIRPGLQRVLDTGKATGLLFSMIVRPTRAEAIEWGHAMMERAGQAGRDVQDRFREQSKESVGFASTYALGYKESDWPEPFLWTGLIPYMGPLSLALIGSPDDIVDALFTYRRIGVTQFLFHGRPDLETLPYFCQEVLPRVRARERDHELV